MPDMRPTPFVAVALLERELQELEVQVAFWKQAAQQAHDLWAKQEAVSIVLREQLISACNMGINIIDYITAFADFSGSRGVLAAYKSEAEAE